MLHPQARNAVSTHEFFDPTRPIEESRKALIDGAADLVDESTDVPVVYDGHTRNGTPIRVYRPCPAGPLPVCLYMHGGGWALGGIETVDELCRRIARYSGCIVVSVGYSKSPEHRFPKAIDDVTDTIAWVRDQREDRGFNGRIAVAGDSAGAYLAAMAALRERDRGSGLDAQVLIYPALDPSMSTSSYTQMDGYTLSRSEMEYFWSAFLGQGDERNGAVSPFDLSLVDLPNSLVLLAEHDVLRDEGCGFARALASAGVDVTTISCHGMVHGFLRRYSIYDNADRATYQVAAFLESELHARRDSRRMETR